MILLEALLRRLYSLPGSEALLVRGSFILRHWLSQSATPAWRACEDLDLLDTQGRSQAVLVALMQQALEQPALPGPVFTGCEHAVIWAESAWPGMRFLLQSDAGSLQVDISQGDPLAAPPVRAEIPSWLRPGECFSVWTIEAEIALAWKLHGLFEHLSGNWRPKDLRDVWLILKSQPIRPELLSRALGLAFGSREDPPELLRRLLYGDLGQSTRSRKGWDSFQAELPEAGQMDLQTVLTDIRNCLIPLLELPDDGSLRTNNEVLDYRLKLLRASESPVAALKLRTLSRKPRFLPYKAYPSMPHLPGSRTGPADKHLPSDQACLLTEKLYRPGDEVLVQEKLDGSCVGAMRLDGRILALGRDGDLAENSPNPARRLWAEWVEAQQARFLTVLAEGERLMGEWLALVHGTRYQLCHEPFVAFDLISGAADRLGHDSFMERIAAGGFIPPFLLHRGGPLEIAAAVEKLGKGHHGSVDPPEGAVWRLERAGRVVLLAKYVRTDKLDGGLLPENTGLAALWNWHPDLPVWFLS
ncbi:MAG TPA: nucleotidyl transferase AbiEii/AbiGii toxin family protein [Candidatus Obscuribacterales bacterium]